MSDSIPPAKASGSFRAAPNDEQTNPRQESVIDLILSGINELKTSQMQTYTLIIQLSSDVKRAHERIDGTRERVDGIESRLSYLQPSQICGYSWVPYAVSIVSFFVAIAALTLALVRR